MTFGVVVVTVGGGNSSPVLGSNVKVTLDFEAPDVVALVVGPPEPEVVVVELDPTATLVSLIFVPGASSVGVELVAPSWVGHTRGPAFPLQTNRHVSGSCDHSPVSFVVVASHVLEQPFRNFITLPEPAVSTFGPVPTVVDPVGFVVLTCAETFIESSERVTIAAAKQNIIVIFLNIWDSSFFNLDLLTLSLNGQHICLFSFLPTQTSRHRLTQILERFCDSVK
ncbi:MAG TPA: hypothetical protein PKA82_10520 [Pyrinomonadaceae bacterium]|nr:hypothetical protein [Pyrinomonadaceae bacterium]